MSLDATADTVLPKWKDAQIEAAIVALANTAQGQDADAVEAAIEKLNESTATFCPAVSF